MYSQRRIKSKYISTSISAQCKTSVFLDLISSNYPFFFRAKILWLKILDTIHLNRNEFALNIRYKLQYFLKVLPASASSVCEKLTTTPPWNGAKWFFFLVVVSLLLLFSCMTKLKENVDEHQQRRKKISGVLTMSSGASRKIYSCCGI